MAGLIIGSKEYLINMKVHLALITLETNSPLFLSAGDEHLVQDNLLIRDHHNLPVIHASQITGALRHLYQRTFDDASWQCLFGQTNDESNAASILVPSNTVLRDINHQMVPLYCPHADITADPLLANLLEDAPVIIDRVKLNNYGVVDNKFDYTVVPTGYRFSFTIELKDLADKYDTAWQNVLQLFEHHLFKLGGATKSGFGVFKLVTEHSVQFSFDYKNKAHKQALLDWNQHPSTFPVEFIQSQQQHNHSCLVWPKQNAFTQDIYNAEFKFSAKQGLHFGASEQGLSHWFINLSDAKTSDKPGNQVKQIERLPKITWTKKANGRLIAKSYVYPVIPTTAVKGAVLQQARYLLSRGFQQYLPALELLTGKVEEDKVNPDNTHSQASVMDWYVSFNYIPTYLEDCAPENPIEANFFRNHNRINRLTGGVMQGGLFSEEYTWQDEFELRITLDYYRLEMLLAHPDANPSNVTMNEVRIVLAVIDRAIADFNDELAKLGGLTSMGYGSVSVEEVQSLRDIQFAKEA